MLTGVLQVIAIRVLEVFLFIGDAFRTFTAPLDVTNPRAAVVAAVHRNPQQIQQSSECGLRLSTHRDAIASLIVLDVVDAKGGVPIDAACYLPGGVLTAAESPMSVSLS